MESYSFKKHKAFDAEREFCNFLCRTTITMDAAKIDAPMGSLPELKKVPSSGVIYPHFLKIQYFQPGEHFSYLEALGNYLPRTIRSDNPEFEIFTENILDAAIQYKLYLLSAGYPSKEYYKDIDVIYEKMKVLVLCHLASHWFIHHSTGNYGPMIGPMCYTTRDEIFYHESLAQAIMMDGIKHSEGLRYICFWMEGHQPDAYTAYMSLKPSLPDILKVFHFLSQTKIQSFELLRQGIRCLQNDCLSIDTVIDGFMRRPYHPSFRKKSLRKVHQYLSENRPDLKEKYEDVFFRLGL